jgi:hypothetical protein
MRRQTNTLNWSADLPLAQGIKFGDGTYVRGPTRFTSARIKSVAAAEHRR